MKACWIGCRWSGVPIPSIVTIVRPQNEATGARQVGSASPSITALHAPHCSTPHPNFAPGRSRSFRSTYSNGVLGSARTRHVRPFTSSAMSSSIPSKVYGAPDDLSRGVRVPAGLPTAGPARRRCGRERRMASATVGDLVDQAFPEMVATRRRLHARPELSFEEHETSALIRARMRALGAEERRCPTPTGGVYVIDAGAPGRT